MLIWKTRLGLAVRGKSLPWPFSTWATPENAEGFPGCRLPHPAAADYFHSLLGSLEPKRIVPTGLKLVP